MNEGGRAGDGRRREGCGGGGSIQWKKRPADTKGRRMTGSAVKPAHSIQEQGHGKDGRDGGRESQDSDQQLQIRFHLCEFVKLRGSTNLQVFSYFIKTLIKPCEIQFSILCCNRKCVMFT